MTGVSRQTFELMVGLVKADDRPPYPNFTASIAAYRRRTDTINRVS